LNILIVSATEFEVKPLQEELASQAIKDGAGFYNFGFSKIKFSVTGVGLVATTFHLAKALIEEEYDLVLNAGVAGSYASKFKIGEVVHVVSECFGDLGAEDKDGSFLDLMEMGLQGEKDFPFENGILVNPASANFQFLPTARGLSVNKVHGFDESIKRIKKKYEVDVESMEGAAVFYTCLQEEQNFLEIRAISNYVEPRNKDNWNMPLAIQNLNKTLIELIEALNEI